jgi:hypothetical protein
LGVVVSAFGEISPRIPTILFVRSLAFVASLSLFFASRLLLEFFFLLYFFLNSLRFVLSFLHIRVSFVFSYFKIMFQLIFFLFHSFMLYIEEIGQSDSILCYLPHFDLFFKKKCGAMVLLVESGSLFGPDLLGGLLSSSIGLRATVCTDRYRIIIPNGRPHLLSWLPF